MGKAAGASNWTGWAWPSESPLHPPLQSGHGDLMLSVIIPGNCWVWALCRAQAGSGRLPGGTPRVHSGCGGAQDTGTGRTELGATGQPPLPSVGAGPRLAGLLAAWPWGRQDFLLPVCASLDWAPAGLGFCLKGCRGTQSLQTQPCTFPAA